MADKIINSISDLLDALDEDTSSYSGAIWYRGHHNSSWSLTPGYYRLYTPPSEGTLLARFKQNASMLINTNPHQSFDWLFLMQHYGVPTRLLDWSENPLVALYFVVEGGESEADSDGALWCLRPSELNKIANINDPDEEFFIPSFEDDVLNPYTLKSLNSNKKLQLGPVATIATRNNPRIQAQLGVFTIHHNDRSPIDVVGKNHTTKYIIPADKKGHLARQLKLLGISKFQLFPELSSIGDIIKDQL